MGGREIRERVGERIIRIIINIYKIITKQNELEKLYDVASLLEMS